MNENPVGIFLKRNTMLSLVGIIAIVICILYYITWDCDELFHNAGVLFSIIYTISVSYVVSVFFYFFQVFLPNYKKQSAQIFFLEDSLDEIGSLMNKPFKKAFSTSEGEVHDLANITETECNEINSMLNGPTGIYREHKEITIYKYMEECVTRIDSIIKDTIVQYTEVMTENDYLILQRIYKSEYHSFIRDNILNPPGNAVPLKKDTFNTAYAGYIMINITFDMIAEYSSMYNELFKTRSELAKKQ